MAKHFAGQQVARVNVGQQNLDDPVLFLLDDAHQDGVAVEREGGQQQDHPDLRNRLTDFPVRGIIRVGA